MPRRLAAVSSLIVFALCLVLGLRADNTFSTTLTRALVAMAGAFVVGLVIGFVAQRMLDENLKVAEERLKKQSESAPE